MTHKNQQKSQQSKSRIPDFSSREEMAEFWDTHDASDYWDELKPVRVRVAKNLSQGITIRLDPTTLVKLRTQAHEKGLGATTLIRMWILEHLKEQERRDSPRA